MKMQLLPIGSVVTLKEGKKKLMIIGVYTNEVSTGRVHDYLGIPYPEGFLNAETMFLFMHEDIETIHFLGYIDSEHQAFRAALTRELEKDEKEKAAEDSKTE